MVSGSYAINLCKIDGELVIVNKVGLQLLLLLNFGMGLLLGAFVAWFQLTRLAAIKAIDLGEIDSKNIMKKSLTTTIIDGFDSRSQGSQFDLLMQGLLSIEQAELLEIQSLRSTWRPQNGAFSNLLSFAFSIDQLSTKGFAAAVVQELTNFELLHPQHLDWLTSSQSS